jgi:2'-5' RNA ligase
MESQSVLVILVPEAEPLVGPFRSKYDSSASDGIPAHITINYPFRSIEEDRLGAIDNLKDLFSKHQTFEYSLIAARQFPGVLYLEPFPDRPLMNLIHAVTERFPKSPPYGGMYKKVVPHLTVAAVEDKETMEKISRHFDAACMEKLPIQATANEIWLMDNRSGMWTKCVSFALAKNFIDRPSRGDLSPY